MLAFRPDEISFSALAEGIRNGLPVAIRRGDLDLAKTCFDLIWGEHALAGRAWLRWDMIPLICAECLPVALLLPEHLETLKAVDRGSDQEERAWRKLVYLATLLPKCRDALMLSKFGPESESKHREMRLINSFRHDLNDDIKSAVMAVYDTAVGSTDPDLKCTYNVLLGRALNDGSISTRFLVGVAMILITNRGTRFQAVSDQIDRISKHMSAKFGRKPKTVDLPWYVWGPETLTGRAVVATMTNKDNLMTELSREQLVEIWSYSEEHHIPEDRLLGHPADKPLSIWHNIWTKPDPFNMVGSWRKGADQTVKEQITAVLGRK